MIDELELAITAIESGIIENIAHESFIALASTDNIKNSLSRWKYKIKTQLSSTPLEENIEDEIAYYQEVKGYTKEYFTENFYNIIEKIGQDSPFSLQINNLITQQEKQFNPLFKHHFCKQWYQSLLDQIQNDRFKKIDKEKLLKDLYQRSETINQLNEINGEINEQKNLRLWDMAKAKLSKRDISQLTKVAKYLKNNSELENIAKKLGRMATKVDTNNIVNVKTEKINKIETKSSNVAGDIVGIHNSSDLERILTTESLFLTSPELETLFYKRLADKQLATYQLQSTEINKQKTPTLEKKSNQKDQDKGPFIIAVDASGSMMGLPENYAKAFAYGLMQIALTDNRDCYIIIFSTQLITYELTKEKGLSEILSFLSYSFNGGTDLTPVLEKSIELMSTDKYTNADLIIISDFIAPAQSDTIKDKIEELKESKNRFHALNLSRYGNPELLATFDHYWQYTPSRISKLKQLFKDK